MSFGEQQELRYKVVVDTSDVPGQLLNLQGNVNTAVQGITNPIVPQMQAPAGFDVSSNILQPIGQALSSTWTVVEGSKNLVTDIGGMVAASFNPFRQQENIMGPGGFLYSPSLFQSLRESVGFVTPQLGATRAEMGALSGVVAADKATDLLMGAAEGAQSAGFSFLGGLVGSEIGAVVGQSLIPMPGVGAVLGGLVGGMVGYEQSDAIAEAVGDATFGRYANMRSMKDYIFATSPRYITGGASEQTGIFGGGFTTGQAGEIAQFISGIESRNWDFNPDMMKSLLRTGTETGMFSGVSGKAEFENVFSELTETVRTVARNFRVAADDAIQIMGNMRQYGMFTPGQMSAQSVFERGIADIGGMSPQEVSSIGFAASRVSAGMGLGLDEAARMTQTMAGQFGYAANRELISQENMTILGGPAGLAQQVGADVNRFITGPAGMAMMAAAYSPATGQMDMNALQNVASGNMMNIGAMAGRNLGSTQDVMNFMYGQNDFGQQMQQLGPYPMMMQAVQMAQMYTPGASGEELKRNAAVVMSNVFGIDQRQSNAMFAGLNEESLNSVIDANRMAMRRNSQDEYMRQHGVTPLADLAKQVYTAPGRWIEQGGEFISHSIERNLAGINRAYAEFMGAPLPEEPRFLSGGVNEAEQRWLQRHQDITDDPSAINVRTVSGGSDFDVAAFSRVTEAAFAGGDKFIQTNSEMEGWQARLEADKGTSELISGAGGNDNLTTQGALETMAKSAGLTDASGKATTFENLQRSDPQRAAQFMRATANAYGTDKMGLFNPGTVRTGGGAYASRGSGVASEEERMRMYGDEMSGTGSKLVRGEAGFGTALGKIGSVALAGVGAYAAASTLYAFGATAATYGLWATAAANIWNPVGWGLVIGGTALAVAGYAGYNLFDQQEEDEGKLFYENEGGRISQESATRVLRGLDPNLSESQVMSTLRGSRSDDAQALAKHLSAMSMGERNRAIIAMKEQAYTLTREENEAARKIITGGATDDMSVARALDLERSDKADYVGYASMLGRQDELGSAMAAYMSAEGNESQGAIRTAISDWYKNQGIEGPRNEAMISGMADMLFNAQSDNKVEDWETKDLVSRQMQREVNKRNPNDVTPAAAGETSGNADFKSMQNFLSAQTSILVELLARIQSIRPA